jgi:hypothetical protein
VAKVKEEPLLTYARVYVALRDMDPDDLNGERGDELRADSAAKWADLDPDDQLLFGRLVHILDGEDA